MKRRPSGKSRKLKPRSIGGRKARFRWLEWVSHLHIPISWLIVCIDIVLLLYFPRGFNTHPPDQMMYLILSSLPLS